MTPVGAAPDEATIIAGKARAAPLSTPPPSSTPPTAPAAAQEGTIVIAPKHEKSVVPSSVTPSDLALGTPTPSSTQSGGSNPFRTEVSQVGVIPMVGARINQYELIRELGQGGMGTVYLARDTKLGRRVAVKFLQTNQPELAQRFLIEARATARCSHENIVIIYEVGEVGAPFMALEYIQGQALQKLIEGGQKLPVARAVELIVPVVRALACAHEQGIVHRDLKPDNVMITETGTVKVLDFGIAKLREASEGSAAEMRIPTDAELNMGMRASTTTGGGEGMTRAGAIMGTMAYMSPEQWGIGGIEIDHRTDIWATGIMLFRMLAGRHPLHPLRGQQLVVTAMLDQPMPSVRESIAGIPAGLADVIDRCLRKKKEERYENAKDLLRALEPFMGGRFTREIHVDQSPYAGLASFQENDAARFFGRTREIGAMVNRIRQQPMLAVIGGSGVGKSSLVRAGLVPALKRSGEPWECVVLRPGRSPLAALAAILNPMMQTSHTIADEVERQGKVVNRLKAEPGYLGTTLRAQAVKENRKVLLFIDQFEELYTNVADAEERMAFTRCLTGAADDATSPVRIVISIRADFLDRVAEHPQFLAELNQGLFFLLSPNRDGLRDALVQPAEMAGYAFEDPKIVEDMLDHLAQTPGALPLLQFTASKLWDARDQARKVFTQASYTTLGGIAGALASHADTVLNKMTPAAQGLVRGLFLRLVTPERTRAVVSMKELEELSQDKTEVKRVIEQLAYARLVVVQTAEAGGVSTIEIVHESLIHGWPALKRWLDEGHEDSVFMEQLRQAAKQWQAKAHDAGLLWRGEIVNEARKFRARYRGQLPWVQESFLRAVFDSHDKGVRRKRIVVGTVIVLLAAIAAAAVVALIFINEARSKAQGALDDAKSQRAKAVKAQGEAEKALTAQIEGEKLRVQAEADKAEADRLRLEQKVKDAETISQSASELQLTNAKMLIALEDEEKARGEAEKEKDRAEDEKDRAERSAKEAIEAKQLALDAKKEVDKLLAKEKKRADELQKRLNNAKLHDKDLIDGTQTTDDDDDLN